RAGETTMPAALLMTPFQTTALRPAFDTPAPIRPPISACDDDDGMPSHQVSRFQTIAPMTAPKITASLTISAETMPLPTVLATCRPKNRKAMKLKKAAHITAHRGASTRVETMVAMEFAASCS